MPSSSSSSSSLQQAPKRLNPLPHTNTSHHPQDENSITADMSFKTILIGEAETGKTCLLKRYVMNTFSEDRHVTIGVDYKFKVIKVGSRFVKLQIWDTAGQESARSLVRRYWNGAAIVLVVFDLTRRDTFESVEGWLREAREVLSTWRDIPFALIGNKSDLEDEREVTTEEVKQFADSEGLLYVETSAKTGANVNTLFERLATECAETTQPEIIDKRPRNSFRLTDKRDKQSSWSDWTQYYCNIL